jgi:hypothetical protein
MRIDMKRQAELNQRKGLTVRTIVSVLWLALCLVLAYFFTGWLVDNGIFDRGLVYGTLRVPTTINLQVARAGAMVVSVVILQFFAVIFFAMMSPAARKRTGRPTAEAQSVDYYEQQYNRRA